MDPILISAIAKLISEIRKAASLERSKFFQFIVITLLIVGVTSLVIAVAKQPTEPPCPDSQNGEKSVRGKIGLCTKKLQ